MKKFLAAAFAVVMALSVMKTRKLQRKAKAHLPKEHSLSLALTLNILPTDIWLKTEAM